MTLRLEPFINDNIYHIFNKTIDYRMVFNNENNCLHLLNTIEYYRSNAVKFSYSQLPRLDPITTESYLKKIYDSNTFRVEILSYCLMPNHFHFLIKQKKDKGISKFMADIINSFTRYFNIKTERKGPIFVSDFKSVGITNEAQFIHVSRYIHLNPYSAGLINNFEELLKYPWSSLKDYTSIINNSFIETKDLLSLFDFDKERYKKFVLSNTEHQKTLETVKYLSKW
jgi:putative transposase